MTISLRRGFLEKANQNIPGDDSINCLNRENSGRKSTALILWLIVLRTSDAGQTNGSENELDIAEHRTRDNLVFTGTALGALRQALDGHTFEFLTPNDAEKLKQDNHNVSKLNNCLNDQFYIAEPSDNHEASVEDEWHKLFKFPFENDAQARLDTRNVGARTVLLIIEHSPDRPTNSYVTVFKNGEWFSINNDDAVTKQNFALLNNIVTVQAAPSNNSPTPTSIVAGGH